jgi:hypothetical protein
VYESNLFSQKSFQLENEMRVKISSKKLGKSVCKLTENLLIIENKKNKSEVIPLAYLESFSQKKGMIKIELKKADTEFQVRLENKNEKILQEWNKMLNNILLTITSNKIKRENLRMEIFSELEQIIERKRFSLKSSLGTIGEMPTKNQINKILGIKDTTEPKIFFDEEDLVNLQKNSDLTFMEIYINLKKESNFPVFYSPQIKNTNLVLKNRKISKNPNLNSNVESPTSVRKRAFTANDSQHQSFFNNNDSNPKMHLFSFQKSTSNPMVYFPKPKNLDSSSPTIIKISQIVEKNLNSPNSKTKSTQNVEKKENSPEKIPIQPRKKSNSLNDLKFDEKMIPPKKEQEENEYNQKISSGVFSSRNSENQIIELPYNDQLDMQSNKSLFESDAKYDIANNQIEYLEYNIESTQIKEMHQNNKESPQKTTDFQNITEIHQNIDINGYQDSFITPIISSPNLKANLDENGLNVSPVSPQLKHPRKVMKDSLDGLDSSSNSSPVQTSLSLMTFSSSNTEITKTRSEDSRSSYFSNNDENVESFHLWNQTFQRAFDSIHNKDIICNKDVIGHQEVMNNIENEFINFSKKYGEIIINELYTPLEQKTIKPSKMGGIIGKKNFFFFIILLEIFF